ncbi:MAG: hypothetical protein A2Z31_01165 [candidate division NC10 bacterium RBG_16_65_8]|nr:MAG: hypothetical protein A2Z31_01165 [candidate division NC10 bacterium RBG_16_65_8]
MIPAYPDAELILATGNFIVPSRSRIVLQVQDGARHPKEYLVVQFKKLALRRPAKGDPTHGGA